MRKSISLLGLIALVALPAEAFASGATLRGSRSAMERQNRIARENDFTFLRTPAQVRHFVAEGRLVPLEGNSNYRVAGVSFPYARPEVALFVSRLAAQYRESCGEQLVVTSATRPEARQPRNSSPLSVHPAGMAVDLRIPQTTRCRAVLEGTLLALEDRAVLDVTRERRPPHYHVAVFTSEYSNYVAGILADSTAAAAELAIAEAREDSIALANAAATMQQSHATLLPAAPAGTRKSAWWLLIGVPLFTATMALGFSILRDYARTAAGAHENESLLEAVRRR